MAFFYHLWQNVCVHKIKRRHYFFSITSFFSNEMFQKLEFLNSHIRKNLKLPIWANLFTLDDAEKRERMYTKKFANSRLKKDQQHFRSRTDKSSIIQDGRAMMIPTYMHFFLCSRARQSACVNVVGDKISQKYEFI